VRIKSLLKKEKALDLVVQINGKISNFGLIKIWIKVKFLMAMIILMDMVHWQLQEPQLYQ
jgi:hypothetical protein